MLNRVDQAVSNIKQATNTGTSLRTSTGPASMLAKMGGRLISFYADDLADLLIDDILRDTAKEMNEIEKKERSTCMKDQSKDLAADILTQIVQFENQ